MIFKTGSYMYPRKIAFVDSLPRTLNGKILRSDLRKIAETRIGK
jgi:acyl-coenzyme A synthetase/AMP-(fatty) acid ligase